MPGAIGSWPCREPGPGGSTCRPLLPANFLSNGVPAMTNKTLARTVARILRQAGVRKMAFNMHGLVVTGVRYAMVAKAVEDGSIECRVVNEFPSQGEGTLAPGMVTVARYQADRTP